MSDSNSPEIKRFRKKNRPNAGKIVKAFQQDKTTMVVCYGGVSDHLNADWDLESFFDVYEPVLA